MLFSLIASFRRYDVLTQLVYVSLVCAIAYAAVTTAPMLDAGPDTVRSNCGDVTA